MKRLARILAVAAVCLVATNGSAQTTLESGVEAALRAQGAGNAPLTQAGAKFAHIAIAERLPSGQWLCEVVLALDEREIRWPLGMRVSEKDGTWEPSWQPSIEYAKALKNMLASERLPRAEGSGSWHSARRLPAMPVIVTSKRYVTPFGALDIKDRGGELRPSIPLLKHAQRWVTEALADDPGPAAIDFIIDASISWRTLNRALFSISAAGLYQVFIIARGESGWTWVGGAAPIAFQKAKGPPGVVVGLYPQGVGLGVRLSMEGEVLEDESACNPEMTLCISDVESFATALTAQTSEALSKRATPLDTAMVGATEDLKAGTVIQYLDRVHEALSVAPHSIMLGLIQK